ncbi:MAG: hypothetical protein IKU46_10505 [Peptococcaceae bacterium]|nr:hypothetical protein [Peptococcaceae bacterium]
MFDYIILAFFAAFLGLKFAQTRAAGHLWFLLPLLLVVGLHQGWASHFGEAFFVFYRVMLLASCALAGYMYYRDYHKRNAEAIAENTEKRRKQEEKMRRQQAQAKAGRKNKKKK